MKEKHKMKDSRKDILYSTSGWNYFEIFIQIHMKIENISSLCFYGPKLGTLTSLFELILYKILKRTVMKFQLPKLLTSLTTLELIVLSNIKF